MFSKSKGEYKSGARAMIVGARTPYGRQFIGRVVTLSVRVEPNGRCLYKGVNYWSGNKEECSWIVDCDFTSSTGVYGHNMFKQSHLMPLDSTDFDKDMFTIEKRVTEKA